MDIFLTDSSSTSSARKCQRVRRQVVKHDSEPRVASHMDTLVLHLSERIVHQMLPTAGAARWYSLRLWALDGAAMQQMSRKLLAMRSKEPESEDD